jgi:hypothetical protein
MHRWLFALALVLTCAACSEEDPAALYADVNYQVRCLDCEPRVADDPERDLAVVDGEQDSSLRCESVGGLVSLEIETSEYAFKILNARLGNDPGDQCEVRVKEGINEYRGFCKAEGSDDEQPCEVELTADGSGFVGRVFCNQIRHHLSNTLLRYVVAPGTTDEPAEVVASGCSGL